MILNFESDQSGHDKPWFYDYEWEAAQFGLRVFTKEPDISRHMLQRLAAEAGLRAEMEPLAWAEVVAREAAVALKARKKFNDEAQAELDMFEVGDDDL